MTTSSQSDEVERKNLVEGWNEVVEMIERWDGILMNLKELKH